MDDFIAITMLIFSRYTCKKILDETVVYAITFEWPDANLLQLGSHIPVKEETTIVILGFQELLKVRKTFLYRLFESNIVFLPVESCERKCVRKASRNQSRVLSLGLDT